MRLLQWNPFDNGYDVMLHSQVAYDGLLMTCKAKAESVPFSLFKVEPLGQRNVWVVTVHMYNPYVSDAAVAIFLGRYGKVDKPVKYLRTITCRSFGHLAAGCTLIRNCGGEGHGATSCSAPKTCNGYGKTGHLFRVCPSSGRTYAAVAGESLGPNLGPLVEELQEVQGVEGDFPAGRLLKLIQGPGRTGRGVRTVGSQPGLLLEGRGGEGRPQEGISQNCRQSLVSQGRRIKWMRAGQHAEAQPNGAPLLLSGRYDILTGDSGEGESSGPVAVKAGPVEGSNM
ncbi:unnamed protein product, partial [Menidia menidia]